MAHMILRLFSSFAFNSRLRLRGVVAASAVPVGTGHDAFIDALLRSVVAASAAPVGTVYDAYMEAQSIVRRWACVVVVSTDSFV